MLWLSNLLRERTGCVTNAVHGHNITKTPHVHNKLLHLVAQNQIFYIDLTMNKYQGNYNLICWTEIM